MVVFITGATSGFGRAIAHRFAREGHSIVATGRRQDRLTALQNELGADKVHIVTLDVQDRDAVATAIESLPANFAEIDVLVNNAGLALGLEPAHKAKLDDWDRMVDTNIKGLMYVTRTILPDMVERNRGHVLNIGSIAGLYAYPGGNVYGATKAFVKHFSLNLRADLLGTKIRVTDVEPGMAGGTEFSTTRFAGDADRAAKVYEGVEPLLPNDIADTVYWAVTRPAHVNINTIEMMPTCQAFGALAVSRDQKI